MVRIILLLIIAMVSLMTLQHYIDMHWENLNTYNQRLVTISYYKKLFDNIVNSGLFDGIYLYSAVLVDADLILVNDRTVFPLYVLSYFEEDSAEYEMALQYFIQEGLLFSSEVVLDYKKVPINYEYLHFFQEKMREFEEATGVNMIVYYDGFKLYESTCSSVYVYEFETIYFDYYGLMHIVRIVFC